MTQAPGANELLNQMALLAKSRGHRSPADIIQEAVVEKQAKKPKRPKKKTWWIY